MTLRNNIENLLIYNGLSADEAVSVYNLAIEKYPELLAFYGDDLSNGRLYRLILSVVFSVALHLIDVDHPARPNFQRVYETDSINAGHLG